jgi:hypothetical protein
MRCLYGDDVLSSTEDGGEEDGGEDEFSTIAVKRLKQEGIENEELALFIANAVLRDLRRKSVRDAIRIASSRCRGDNTDT